MHADGTLFSHFSLSLSLSRSPSCSGQVTGGVLRGDRARFQLFGDTVNTAARMESTGERGRIQLSRSTADLIIAAGKDRWVIPREDAVAAKGKGIMQTYWLEIGGAPAAMTDSTTGLTEESQPDVSSDPRTSVTINASKQESRLVGWMTEVLLDYVKQIVSSSGAKKPNGMDRPSTCMDGNILTHTLPPFSSLNICRSRRTGRFEEEPPVPRV